MSKRSERRAAERANRKISYQQLRQARAQQAPEPSHRLSAPQVHPEPSVKPESDLLARARAFFNTPSSTVGTDGGVHEETSPINSKASTGRESRPPNKRGTSADLGADRESVVLRSSSEARLAANRANARLSTGPVTSQGRAKSSMNALKFGLTGKTVVLPGEDQSEYDRQLAAAIHHSQPASEEEQRLIHSLVDCAWRLSRIQQIESAIFLKGTLELAGSFEDRSPFERHALIQAEVYLKYEKSLRNLQIQEARLRRTIEKASTGRDSAPPNKRGTSADLGADRESVVLRSSSEDRAELQRLQLARKREEEVVSSAQKQESSDPAVYPNGFVFANQSSVRSEIQPHPQNGVDATGAEGV